MWTSADTTSDQVGYNAVRFHLALFAISRVLLGKGGKKQCSSVLRRHYIAQPAGYSLGIEQSLSTWSCRWFMPLLNFTFTIMKRPSTPGWKVKTEEWRESAGERGLDSALSSSLPAQCLPLRQRTAGFCTFQLERWIVYGTVWFKKHNTFFFCYSKPFSITSLKGVGQRKWSFGWR